MVAALDVPCPIKSVIKPKKSPSGSNAGSNVPLTAFKCAAVLFMAFAVVDDVFNMGLTVQALETVSRPIGGVFVDVMNMGGETIINAALDFSNAVFGTDFGDFHTESNYYLTADGLFDTQEGSFGLKLATDRPELVGNDIHMARNDIAGVDFNNGVISANYTPYEDRLPVTAHNQKILNVTFLSNILFLSRDLSFKPYASSTVQPLLILFETNFSSILNSTFARKNLRFYVN